MNDHMCFQENRLRDYALGVLDDESSAEIERHLDDCHLCDDVISSFDAANDSLVRSLRIKPNQADAPSWIQKLADQTDGDFPLGDAVESESDTSDVPADPLVIGDYRLQTVIGRGGMSVVFRARHLRLERDVAFKVLKHPVAAGRMAIERFCREMKSIGSLSHPAIVQATDAGECDGVHYLVMEQVYGVDLSRLLYEAGPLPIAAACRICCDVADALQHAHDAGIVHRDLKPSNIMLDRNGRVKLLDFGLARLETTTGQVTQQTTVGQLLGTLDYMAPEQADGGSVDGRADIYSLAATLFRLLTGQPPMGRSAETPLLQFVHRLGNEAAPAVDDLRTDVPKELATVVADALVRDPAQRIASADDFRKQLEPFAESADMKSLVEEAFPESTPAAQSSIPVARTEETESACPELYEVVRQVFPNRTAGIAAANVDLQPAAQQQSETVPPKRRWPWLVALSMLGPVIVWGIVLLLKTPDGVVRIESEADDVQVELVDEKDAVTKLLVNKTGDETEIRAGRYRVRLAGGSEGLQITPNEIVVGPDQVSKATIRRDGAAVAEANGQSEEERARQATLDRQIAESSFETLRFKTREAVTRSKQSKGNDESVIRDIDAVFYEIDSDDKLADATKQLLLDDLRTARQSLTSKADETAAAEPTSAADLLTAQAHSLELQLAESRKELGPGHPTVLRLKTKLAHVKRLMSDSPQEPVFNGKPLSHWQAVVKYETLDEIRDGAGDAILELVDSVPKNQRIDVLLELFVGLKTLQSEYVNWNGTLARSASETAHQVISQQTVNDTLLVQLKSDLNDDGRREGTLLLLAMAGEHVRQNDAWKPIVDEALRLRAKLSDNGRFFLLSIVSKQKCDELVSEYQSGENHLSAYRLMRYIRSHDVPLERRHLIELAGRADAIEKTRYSDALLPAGPAADMTDAQREELVLYFTPILDACEKQLDDKAWNSTSREFNPDCWQIAENFVKAARVPRSLIPRTKQFYERCLKTLRDMHESTILKHVLFRQVRYSIRSFVLLTGKLPENVMVKNGESLPAACRDFIESRNLDSFLDTFGWYPVETVQLMPQLLHQEMLRFADPAILFAMAADESIPQDVRTVCAKQIPGHAAAGLLTKHASLQKTLQQLFESDGELAANIIARAGKGNATIEVLQNVIADAKTPDDFGWATLVAFAWSDKLSKRETDKLILATSKLPIEYFEVNRLLHIKRPLSDQAKQVVSTRALKFLQQLDEFEKRCQDDPVPEPKSLQGVSRRFGGKKTPAELQQDRFARGLLTALQSIDSEESANGEFLLKLQQRLKNGDFKLLTETARNESLAAITP